MKTYKQKFNKKFGYPLNQSNSLEQISADTGYQVSGLKIIVKKGEGAYFSNPQSVRSNVQSSKQWGIARVYSSVMGGKAKKIDEKHLKKIDTSKLYKIKRYTYNQAKKLNVKVYPSQVKGKKIDVFKNGKKIATIGALGYLDYPTYIIKKGKKIADIRRLSYKKRHENNRKVKNSNGFFADNLLW